MRPRVPNPGDRIETLPQVGVARGVVLEKVQMDYGCRRVWRWKCRVQLPGAEEVVFLHRSEFEILPGGPPLEPEEAAAVRHAKRRGAAK